MVQGLPNCCQLLPVYRRYTRAKARFMLRPSIVEILYPCMHTSALYQTLGKCTLSLYPHPLAKTPAFPYTACIYFWSHKRAREAVSSTAFSYSLERVKHTHGI